MKLARLLVGPAFIGTALFIAVLPCCPASAQESRQLQGVEAALQQSQNQSAALGAAAAKLAKEMAALQAQLVRSAAEVQAAEADLSRLEASLGDLEARQNAKAAELARHRKALAASLAALLRLASVPPGAALVSVAPLDLARGSLLLSVAIPILQHRAQALEEELAALASLGRLIEERKARAQGLAMALDVDRRQVAQLLAEKARLQRQTAADIAANKARSSKLAAEAKDLRELLDKLAAAQAQAPAPVMRPTAIRAFPTLPGSLVQPVVGSIHDEFGTPDAAAGSTGKGIEIETRADAAVVAPFDGQILFQGPFRSYGEILIIQHAGGYHSLLAGLARSDATVGQWVLAGEPVGVMGQSKDGNPKLYMELRRDGRPIDPAPWLGKSDSKME